jgi:hypothetical protein
LCGAKIGSADFGAAPSGLRSLRSHRELEAAKTRYLVIPGGWRPNNI